MKISIIGAGAIGGLLGAKLQKANYEVTLIAKEDQARVISNQGIILEGEGKETIKVKVRTEEETGDERADLVILATKAYDTQKAASLCRELVSNNGLVLSIQNGLGNEEILAESIDKEKIIGAVTHCGASTLGGGKIKVNGIGETIIGYYYDENQDSSKIKKIQQVLSGSGLPCRVSEDIKQDIYEKFIINTGINALGAIAQVKNGMLISNTYLQSTMENIIKEAREVAKAENIPIPENIIHKTREICDKTKNNTNSLYQDVLKKKKTEIDFFNGMVVKKAKDHHISVPYNQIMTNLIKAKEDRY